MQERKLWVEVFGIYTNDEIFDKSSVQLRVINQNLMISRIQKASKYIVVLPMYLVLESWGVDSGDICELIVIALVIKDMLPSVKLLFDAHSFKDLHVVEVQVPDAPILQFMSLILFWDKNLRSWNAHEGEQTRPDHLELAVELWHPFLLVYDGSANQRGRRLVVNVILLEISSQLV